MATLATAGQRNSRTSDAELLWWTGSSSQSKNRTYHIMLFGFLLFYYWIVHYDFCNLFMSLLYNKLANVKVINKTFIKKGKTSHLVSSLLRLFNEQSCTLRYSEHFIVCWYCVVNTTTRLRQLYVLDCLELSVLCVFWWVARPKVH